ncbi:Imm27 family immunity protein [Hymenobacter sp. AT01-02]|uniref:Imm27 family immunity protein n=1 Tax=Hymenobacter sp. AT01-02 TaxID=1571877 RepID=UPI000A640541
MQFVAVEQNGWGQLYQNPADSCYWGLSFPQGHLQGGGPPTLTRLKQEEVSQQYRVSG